MNSDESKLFKAAMKGVKKLQLKTKVSVKPSLKPLIRKSESYQEMKADHLSDHENQAQVSAYDIIEYFRPGLHHKTIRALKRGEVIPESTLDLHGMTIDEAREALILFLEESKITHARILLIIHGMGRKSEPILKNKLNNWLRQCEEVLAFRTAHPKQGGFGAVYVYLRSGL